MFNDNIIQWEFIFNVRQTTNIIPTAIVDDCLAVTVDLENSEIQKSDKELFIGFSAIQCIQKNNMEGICAGSAEMSSSNDCWDTVFLFKGSIKTACLMIASFSGNLFLMYVRQPT
jgi:hypothetical protein